MRCPYAKPKKFSDPYRDWYDCERRLQSILDKEAAKLEREDYGVIFQQHLPAADYEEGCYYVFPYIEYLSRTSGLEKRVDENFFWYIEHFADRFKADGLLEPILTAIWNCFIGLTKTFRIVRLSDNELEEFKMNDSYREIAHLSRTVAEILDPMTRWPVFETLLVQLEDYFAEPKTVGHSHWYCELAFHTRFWLWLEEEPLARFQRVFDYFHRLDRFKKHDQKIMFSPISDGFYEYNRRLSPN